MANFYMLEAVNLFCGDDAEGKFLTIDELKVPDLTEAEQDHTPGGGRVGVGVVTHVEKLESTFKLAGYDPEMLKHFGLGKKARQRFTALGVVRDKRTGRAIEAKAILEARLGKIAPDAFKKGDLQGHEYALMEIMHYELYFDSDEQFYWDFFTNAFRVNGSNEAEDENRILRILG